MSKAVLAVVALVIYLLLGLVFPPLVVVPLTLLVWALVLSLPVVLLRVVFG